MAWYSASLFGSARRRSATVVGFDGRVEAFGALHPDVDLIAFFAAEREDRFSVRLGLSELFVAATNDDAGKRHVFVGLDDDGDPERRRGRLFE